MGGRSGSNIQIIGRAGGELHRAALQRPATPPALRWEHQRPHTGRSDAVCCADSAEAPLKQLMFPHSLPRLPPPHHQLLKDIRQQTSPGSRIWQAAQSILNQELLTSGVLGVCSGPEEGHQQIEISPKLCFCGSFIPSEPPTASNTHHRHRGGVYNDFEVWFYPLIDEFSSR